MSRWSDAMRARLAGRAAERLPEAAGQPEAAEREPGKLPVAGPPAEAPAKRKREKAKKPISTKAAIRILNRAASGGLFASTVEAFREACKDKKDQSRKEKRAVRLRASETYGLAVRAVAADLLGEPLPLGVRYTWSKKFDGPCFRSRK
jgi:hypothetical protein